VLTHLQLAGGTLYLFEIPDLRLSAALVVLSGCRTSIGALDSGDEIAALGRAFLANGAAAVVVSLWKVDDRSTSRFMESFYSRLKQDGVAGALAFAKRQMIHSLYDLDASGEPMAFSHPFYWSGLIAAGNVQ
jgi:CHAT domain-containing protein